MLFLNKNCLIVTINKKTICFNKKFKNRLVYLKYFYILKKKRKIFKFIGLCFKNKKFFSKIKIKLNNEIFFLNFYIFNPFIIIYKIYFQKYRFIYLYKEVFINFLIELLCSQYKFKKYFFFIKTKYRFR